MSRTPLSKSRDDAMPERVVLEQAMQIATSTPTISTQPTISALAVYREGRSAVLHIARRLPILSDEPCTSQVNLVCLQILIVKGGEESAPGWRVDMGVTEARGLLVESS